MQLSLGSRLKLEAFEEGVKAPGLVLWYQIWPVSGYLNGALPSIGAGHAFLVADSLVGFLEDVISIILNVVGNDFQLGELIQEIGEDLACS